MDWPQIPFEQVAPQRFRPDRCPLPDCPSNQSPAAAPFRYTRHGTYTRKCDGRVVGRVRCQACDRTFSSQTFATSYYLKRPELLIVAANGVVSGQAHRQTARCVGCAASTITRLTARLGRHAMLLHAYSLSALGELTEPIGYDHFEAFGISQYFPIGVGTPVGQVSRFVYGLDAAPHRRTGRMSTFQKQRRRTLEDQHGRPPRDSYARAATATLDLLLARVPSGRKLELVSDDHGQYVRAVRRHPRRQRIVHRRFPNPPRGPKGTPRSAAARRRDQELATVDHAHQFLRHSASHHRRETLAFARRHTALLERLFLHVVWLNLIKLWRETDPRSGTRAQRVGLTSSTWTWERLLAQRMLPHEIDLPAPWRELYFRQPRYPEQYEQKPHALLRAV